MQEHQYSPQQGFPYLKLGEGVQPWNSVIWDWVILWGQG